MHVWRVERNNTQMNWYNPDMAIKYRLMALVILSWIMILPANAQPLIRQSVDNQSNASRTEVMRLTRLARQAESDARIDSALELWQSVMETQPGDYSAYLGIRRCLVELERF